MKRLVFLLLGSAAISVARGGEITVQKIKGDVSVRQGVAEVWTRVAPGDVLRPNDSMKTGKGGSAVLVTVPADPSATARRITLPAQVIVDMSDLRELSPEELMLNLTMEKVRASSYQWKNDELRIPDAGVVHGANQTQTAPLSENELQVGVFLLNGTKVLFQNGFYSTCVLKAMEVFRLYPSLGTLFENRLMVADALVKANLRGEGLSAYGSLLRSEGLTAVQQAQVRERVDGLHR